MKSFFPRTFNHNLRMWFACLLSFLMLTAPMTPLAATSNVASYVKAEPTRNANAKQPAETLTPKAAVNPFTPFAPTVTATLADDITLAQKKVPGATITYTATITDSVTDATGVSFTDTLDSNTTQSGTVKVSPVTVNDSYSCTGNLSITIGAGAGVLANDYLGQNPAGTVTANTSGSNGATVTVNADGSFSYEPAAGFTGIDTFTYTLSNVTGSSIGTVAVTVTNKIWFINNTAAACASSCNGRFSHPYTSLANFIAANPDTSGDRIFIYQGTSSYSGALTLKSNERLIGQGDDLNSTTLGFTPAANGPTLPTATAKPTLTNTLTLAQGVTVLAISMSTGASTGITGSGGLTSVTVGDSPTTATNGVTVTTTTGTTVSLNNVGGTFTFRSLSCNGATTGISLTSTPASLSFTVTGDNSGQANGSGGSLANITGGALGNAPAYFLTSSGNVTLKSMNMSITINAFSGMLVDNNAGGTITVNVTGCTFIGVQAGNSTQNKALLQFEGGNTGGSAANVTANVQDSFFFDNRTYGLFATAAGDSIMNVTLNQSGFGTDVNSGAPVNNPGTTITNPPPFAVGITNGSNAKVDYSITNNTFWGGDGTKGAIYEVTISGASTTVSSHLNGTFSGNKIGKAGVLSSGCANNCAGLGLLPGTAGAFNPTVTNNDIRQVNSLGINFQDTVGVGATFTSSAKFKNNMLAEPDTTGSPTFQRALVVSPINSGGASTTVCAEIGGPGAGEPNIISGAWQAGNFIRLTNLANTNTLRLPGYGGAATDTAAVNAFVAANNGGASCNSTAGTLGFAGGAACPLLLAEGGVMAALNAPSLVSSLLLSSLSTSPITIDAHRATITAPSTVSTSLNQQQLDAMVTAATARWAAAGLTPQQITILRGIKFEVSDLSSSYLGEAEGNRILVDRNAEGKGWFVDPSPLSDASFARAVSATRFYTDPANAAAGHVDLLTAIEHEMGHRLGLDDSYLEKDRDSIMYGYLTVGERRLPVMGQAQSARLGNNPGRHFLSLRNMPTVEVPRSEAAPFSGETITFNLPVNLQVGKGVTIKYDATVNTPPLARSVSTQGTVSGSNFASVLTDDPEPAGATDPTVTNIDTVITWTGATSTDWNDATNWNLTGPMVSTYAPGVTNPAVNDVSIPNVGNQPNIGTTDITIFSLNISNGRTLTITSPRILTIGGAPGGNLTLDGIISGGELRLGTGTHSISNAGGTGSLTSTNLMTVLSGSTVTLSNNLSMGRLSVNAGGSMDITNRTLTLTGPGAALSAAGSFTTTGSTVSFASTTGAQTTGTVYNNLIINNAAGVTLTGDSTVNGTLALTSGDLNTGAFTLTQPNTTASTGTGDVIGSVKRTGGPFAPATVLTFGNPNNQISFTAAGTKPTDITVLMAKVAPATYAAAVQRNYTISQTGGSGFTATLRLHYLDSELNGNVEANLNLRRGPLWQAVLPSVVDTTNNWVECNAVTGFSQWTFSSLVPTAANSIVSGRIVEDNGNPVEGAVVRLSGTQNRKTITDANGNYTFAEVETNGFYTVTPSRVNYNFAPATRGFSALGAHTEASFTASANGNHQNPLDTTEYFVRQQYVDFLGREPEETGFNDWTDTINNCAPNDASCDRIHVSEMFFRSEEFQQRGYFVYRFYSTAFGQKPDYAAFAPDLARVSGFLTNEQLEAAKVAFANDFVTRPAFSQYNSLSNVQYVDALSQTAGVSLSNRQALVDSLNAGTLTHAQALRQIAESSEVYQRYYNQAFVVMEYFGYLRRDPDILYLNWIDVLNQGGDSRHMVEGFVNATEYRNRFRQ